MVRFASLVLLLALGASPITPAAAAARTSTHSGTVVALTLDAEDIASGEFVTAECVHERGRLLAVRVTMAELR